MGSFQRIIKSEKFLRDVAQTTRNPGKLRRLVKSATGQQLLALGEILKNLKHVPLRRKEKVQFCKRRSAIRTFIKRNTKCEVRRSICLKRRIKPPPRRRRIKKIQRGGKKQQQQQEQEEQTGGILPLLPLIASVGVSLLNLLRKRD
jgi:hypothetical protein